MIKLTELKAAINAVLKDNFPDHGRYADDIQEGYQRPCFFVQMFPITFDYDTVNYASGRLMFVVNYFSAGGTQLENLKMHDDLKEAFGQFFQVGDRYLRLRNIRSDEADGILQFKFDIDYMEELERDLSDYDLMEELIMDGKGGIENGTSQD